MRKIIVTGLTVAFVASMLGGIAASAKSGPGRCGENMYYSPKDHKCIDAREKGDGSAS